jgi:hypothetical protein
MESEKRLVRMKTNVCALNVKATIIELSLELKGD